MTLDPLRPLPTPRRRPESLPEPTIRRRGRLWRWVGNALFFLACAAAGAGLAWAYKHFRDAPATPTATAPAVQMPRVLPAMRGVGIHEPTAPDAGAAGRWETTFDQIRGAQANWVAWHWTAHAETPLGTGGPTRARVEAAHGRGLKVALVPRAAPSRLARGPLAKLCQQSLLAAAAAGQETGADLLCIVDDPRLGLDEAGWRKFLGEVRTRFKRPLAFAASVDDYGAVAWFDAVDYLAVTGPFVLTDRPKPTPQQLEWGWAAHLDALESLAAKLEKPALLLEVGFGIEKTTREGWTGVELQRLKYRATLAATKDRPHLAGVFLEAWPAPGGAIPAGKAGNLSVPPLLDVLKEEWGSGRPR